jgi:ABC-type Fe3+-hydroxamate transport system substrate-binding protein
VAEISVVDDTGATVRLAQPAKRIVSLAPHLTETLFAAGAGERIVGTSSTATTRRRRAESRVSAATRGSTSNASRRCSRT